MSAKKLLVVSDGEHSPLGPSSAKRWLNCPGSVLATKKMPDENSIFAIKGTAAHHLSDLCRTHNVHPSKYLGWGIDVRRGASSTVIDVDQEMVDSVQYFIDYVNALPGVQSYEARIQYEHYVEKGFGTMDHASAEEELVHIVDFKDGQGVQVYAEDNPQLKLYALGYWLDYGWAYPNVKRFKLHIVQPRLDHTDDWEISLDDLLVWAHEVVAPGALRTKDPNAPLVPGPWCSENFCRIRRTCAVRANQLAASVVGEFENLDELEEKAERLPGSHALLTNDEIARLMKLKGLFTSFFKDLSGYTMSELQQGHPVGDFKLVAGKTRRVWTFADNDIAQLLLEAGLTEDDVWTKKILSPPKAEKRIGKKHPLMETHVRKISGKPTLVDGNDKRPALSADTLREFGDLDEGDEPESD